MTIWIDAQLSPALALWIFQTFGISAVALRDIGLRDGTDREIFLAAKEQSTIVMTKDADFVRLLEALGSPPQIIWITCGNTSNEHLRQLLRTALPRVLALLSDGESLVEREVINSEAKHTWMWMRDCRTSAVTGRRHLRVCEMGAAVVPHAPAEAFR